MSSVTASFSGAVASGMAGVGSGKTLLGFSVFGSSLLFFEGMGARGTETLASADGNGKSGTLALPRTVFVSTGVGCEGSTGL